MKLKQGKREYGLPNVGKIVDVIADDGLGRRAMLEPITLERMKAIVAKERDKPITGFPTLYAISVADHECRAQTMHVWPAPPDDSHKMDVRFYPPMLVA